MNTCKQIVLAVTGASGACYARRFLERAAALEGVAVHVVLTDTAREIWRHELGCEPPVGLDDRRFDAPFCSGSSAADAMVILPCSMGMLGRIAAGTADDAIARMADVQLKERRPLIVVPRETPLNLIHLRNMTTLAEAGAVIANNRPRRAGLLHPPGRPRHAGRQFRRPHPAARRHGTAGCCLSMEIERITL